MIIEVVILDVVYDVEYDYTITTHGTTQTWDDPAEPCEYTLEVTGIYKAKSKEEIQLPEWLKETILEHLYNSDDVNARIQEADMESGSDPDLDREEERDMQ